LHFVHHIA
jgi:hypothetical protein